jgi:inorganic pyrophosphatase
VDCFVLTETALLSGSTIECEPVGLIEQVEDGAIDHKVLAILPGADTRLGEAVVARLRNFIAAVFAHVPDKRIALGALRAAAEDYLRQCQPSTPAA